MKIKETIQKAITAIEKEIEAVRETPSSDVLMNGVKEKRAGHHIYVFESNNQGLRFAEEIKARIGLDKEQKVEEVDFKDGKVWLEFDQDEGKKIDEVYLEWENDFVLRKMEDHLHTLKDKWKEVPQLDALLNPASAFKAAGFAAPPNLDELRNDTQIEAIEKALINNVLYVWGPPGTGKTATLGFIIANLLKQGKRVLFVSNTNRAVDVGLLSMMDALYEVQPEFDVQQTTRFGEAWLEDERLEDVLFENQVKIKLDGKKAGAIELQTMMDNYNALQDQIDELMTSDEEVPEAMDLQIQLIGEKIDRLGGREEVEENIEKLLNINERHELKKKQLVATTMAKVCTSELFFGISYDAVVVDEASMAGIPYMLLMAAKSKKHLVVAGDPMQLPPISITNDPDARFFLEQDIFTYVSGADSTESLFQWHDENPQFTCFFDTQYRLKSDLAGVISSVFYEGRLKSGKEEKKARQSSSSVALVDSSKYGPSIEQEKTERGFKPVNDVHLRLIEESVKKLKLKHIPEEIGVIVPFRSSVYQVRNYLREKNFRGIEVGTIHTFQGREKEVIIFDTVMSGELQYGQLRHYSVRPFDETKNGLSVPRLLNVAFSRSKELLVVIADMNHVERVYGKKFLGKLLGSVKEISL
ncbi:MAG: DNA2/NAM7 family helicase [Balneolaceae bacterium]|nr:DNA2/NAM7 family helicase [Balneolaceae bacterium]MBO6544963.1 DNA2/NAM7 family helicase [Balneolaceae bacterium]MBO6646359.1 DNA2/NAM7 family helicase [Balneolaceae bacterium]